MHGPLKKNALAHVSVKEAMRRQLIGLPGSSPLGSAIQLLTKYKVNALLITDEYDAPMGIVSKTDLVAAYYADLPLESPLEYIMVSPLLFCNQEDSLESALETMKTQGVYRLYVTAVGDETVVGALAYPDIVGLLYRYCRGCEYSMLNRRKHHQKGTGVDRVMVKDVMTPCVTSFMKSDALSTVMEGLSAYRFGAVLITDGAGTPCGVISKTDLVLAYKRGVSQEAAVETVLKKGPVLSCDEEEFIEDAIHTMIFSEVHRLFVHKDAPHQIVGVFSLSDAARIRSGSCHACVVSRIRVEDNS